MKESYEEDLASRFGLQRRVGYGNVCGLSVREEGAEASQDNPPLLLARQLKALAGRPSSSTSNGSKQRHTACACYITPAIGSPSGSTKCGRRAWS
jgi:hypothetical protein